MSKQISSLDSVKRILAGGSMPGEKAKGGDQRRYKLPATVDEVRMRVLPQKDDPTFPMKISIYHYDMPGISKGNKDEKYKKDTKPTEGKERGASVKCLQMFGIDCPVCKVLKKYEGRAELEDWVARISGVANVLIKEDPTQRVDSRLPHITYFSVGVIKWFEKMFESEDGPALVNVKNGYDIIIHRKKFNGAFEIRNGLTASPLADTPDKIKEIMANSYNLSDIIGKPDDNMISRSKEAARFLDAEIESMILAKADLATGTGDDNAEVPSIDPDEQVPEFEQETTTTEAETTAEETQETAGEATAEQDEEAELAAAKAAKAAQKVAPAAAKTTPATKTAPKPAAQGKPKETAKAAPAKAAAAAPKEAKSKTAVTKPAGAPDCYANEKIHDPAADQCLECPHEFHCENAINAAKA